MPPKHWWKGLGIVEWVGSSLFKAVREQPLGPLLAGATDHHKRHLCLPRLNSKGLQCYKSQWLSPNWWTWQLHVNLKAEGKHHNKTPLHDNKITGRLNFEKGAYLWRTNDTAGICLRRHLGLMLLLLWYVGWASRTPDCVLQNQLWQQNHIMLTLNYLAHRGVT